MSKKETIKVFEDRKIRSLWDDEMEEWYFSIVDIVGVLTESPNPRKYWSVLKTRLKKEGSELATNCSQLKMSAADGKKYKTDCVDTEQLFRLIQSIPSPKAEPFKQWMATVASERLNQIQDPELSIEQAMMNKPQMNTDKHGFDFMEKLLDGVEVEWKTLGETFDISAGGDKPKEAMSEIKTEEYNIPILSNGIDKKALYGWTNKAKINKPSLTISARGTIGWTSIRKTPFFPIVRLIVLTPRIELNLKFAYYYMKTIEDDYKVPKVGIPQLTKPMIKDTLIPIPCPENLEKSLKVQEEIVRILDTFTELTAELTARKKQYSYYREELLSFEPQNSLPQMNTDKHGFDVEWKTLGEVGEFIRGNGLPKTDFTESGVPAIHYGQIYTYYGVYTYDTISFVSEETAIKLKKVEKGDVIITNTSENLEDVGKAVVYLGEEQAVTGGHASIFKPGNLINAKYFAYFTQTAPFFKQKRKLAKGTKVIDVSAKDMMKIKIPIPPLAEQERIVSILDKFDALTNSITEGLPREIELRKKQYEYYRDKLLTFNKDKYQC